jgi:hypothetical protein
MRPRPSGEHESLDAAEEMALYELAEIGAARELSVPSYVRDGIASGRLRLTGGGYGNVRLVLRRLAYRSVYAVGSGRCVVLRCVETGAVVRLPYE